MLLVTVCVPNAHRASNLGRRCLLWLLAIMWVQCSKRPTDGAWKQLGAWMAADHSAQQALAAEVAVALALAVVLMGSKGPGAVAA